MQPYLITPATGLPISLELVKTFCHIDSDHTAEDDVLTLMIQAAWKRAEIHQRRCLLPTTWAVDLDFFPCVIRLPMPPLRSVTSIVYYDASGSQGTLDSSSYLVNINTTPGEIFPVFNGSFPSTRGGRNDVTITFTAGYDDANSIPKFTQLGIAQLAAHFYQYREAVSEMNLMEIPMHCKWLLDADRWC